MNINDFPNLKRLVTTPSEDRWNRPFSEKQIVWLEEGLATWGKGMAEGGIDNPRFVESKDIIGRALEMAWQRVPRDDEAIQKMSDPHRNALDTLPAPNLSNIAGRLKRVKKTPESPMREALIELLTELEPLAEAYAFLKANTRKRQVKSEEEREAERFRPPPSSSKAVARVRKTLEEAIDRAYQGLVDRYTKGNRRVIEGYLKAQEEVLADPEKAGRGYSPRIYFSKPNHRGRLEVVDPHGVAFLSRVLNWEYKTIAGGKSVQAYGANDESYTQSDKMAHDQAKLVRDQFLYKSLVKLTPILEAKGDEVFDSITEVGRFDLERMEGEFNVTFNDGSSFRLRNAVVFVVNNYGTQFNRFPSTFHDVTLPNGEAMPSPSEERMHTVFAQAPVAIPEATAKSRRPGR